MRTDDRPSAAPTAHVARRAWCGACCIIGLALIAGCTDNTSLARQRQALGTEGESVYFEWSATTGLQLRTRVPLATVKPWPDGERGWRLERLDGSGAVLDVFFVEPGTVLRVPEGPDGPPAVVRDSGGAMVHWRRDPAVRTVRLLGQQWTVSSTVGAGQGWEWVTLGDLAWDG